MATHSSVLAWRISGMGGAWWAAVYGVAQSWTRLKQLSSSSSSNVSILFMYGMDIKPFSVTHVVNCFSLVSCLFFSFV